MVDHVLRVLADMARGKSAREAHAQTQHQRGGHRLEVCTRGADGFGLLHRVLVAVLRAGMRAFLRAVQHVHLQGDLFPGDGQFRDESDDLRLEEL